MDYWAGVLTLLADEGAIAGQSLGLLEPLVVGQLVDLAALSAVPAAKHTQDRWHQRSTGCQPKHLGKTEPGQQMGAGENRGSLTSSRVSSG